MPNHSVAEYLDSFLKRAGECAYAQPEGYRMARWTYRQVAETAYRFARELEARGMVKGDRILLWGANGAEWVSVFLGCALGGVIVVPMDHAASPDFALRVARLVNAKLGVCSRVHATACQPLAVLVLEELVAELARHSVEPYPPCPMAPADVLEIVFTSGTTGEPKGVAITHANVLANLRPLKTEITGYLKYERLVHPLRFLTLLPLSHVFGQFLGMFLPPLMGATVIFQETMKPADIVATIRRERVSVLVSVPRVLQSLREKVRRDFADRGRRPDFERKFSAAADRHFLWRWWIFRRVHRQFGWKFWAFISGGAALDRLTEEFWGRLGFAVIQGYGLTETTSLISVNHPFHVGKGSIGKVLAGREMKLAPDGEIMVRGGGIAAGYWKDSKLEPVTGNQGWYRTGDVGETDAEGNLYFKGRKKEVIVTPAGMNIYPEDLEAALRAQPEVKDCAIVALPREGNAEPCPVVILRDPESDLSQVVGRANQSLAEYQRMHTWFLWPEEDFPRTSTQKPKTAEILQAVLVHRGRAAAAGPTAGPLAQLIGRITGRAPEGLAPETSLEMDLNLSSLDRVELMGALEDHYQVDLNETRFAAISTLGDLERTLRGEESGRARYHYPRWAERWPVTWIRLVVHYLLVRPSVFLLGWPRVEGRENLRAVRGPVLVVSNHVDDVDVGFVQTVLPARFRHRLATAAGGEALEILRTPPPDRSLIGRMYDRVKWTLGVALLNLFPLPRAAGFRESFAYAGESIDRGYSILVFPEGHHTTDGKLRPFRAGIGLLVNNLRVPVVPVRLDGLFAVKQAGKRFARPGQIKVKIGAPLEFPPGCDPAWIAEELRKRIDEL